MNKNYSIVLTHDVDHLALVNKPILSRAVGSFFKRSLFSNFGRFFSGDITFSSYLGSIVNVGYFIIARLGLTKDPMEKCLDRIIRIEEKFDVKSTFFFLPFKDTPGHLQEGEPAPQKRGVDYDIRQYSQLIRELDQKGWEIGVHGINAHIGETEAKKELKVFQDLLPEKKKWGLRMHWLVSSAELWKNARKAGFYYDSTFGSNEDVGFISNHDTPFKKDGLWVLPITIQDGALLAPWHKNLTLKKAWQEIEIILREAAQTGAMVTILWHNASFGPPKFWDEVYEKIIQKGKRDGARFYTALAAVERFIQKH